MDKVNGKLTVWGTFQAPHAVRTVASLISTIPEHNIRIVSPDIGGGFGNKVGVYPGYICSIVASIVPACRSNGSRTASRTCPPRPLPATTT